MSPPLNPSRTALPYSRRRLTALASLATPSARRNCGWWSRRRAWPYRPSDSRWKLYASGQDSNPDSWGFREIRRTRNKDERDNRAEEEDDLGRILSQRERKWRRFAESLRRNIEKDPYEALFGRSNDMLWGRQLRLWNLPEERLWTEESSENPWPKKVDVKNEDKTNSSATRTKPIQGSHSINNPSSVPQPPNQKTTREAHPKTTTTDVPMPKAAVDHHTRFEKNDTSNDGQPTSYADMSSSFTRKYDPISGRMVYKTSLPSSPTPKLSTKQTPNFLTSANSRSLRPIQAEGQDEDAMVLVEENSSGELKTTHVASRKELPNDDIDLLLPHDVRASMGRPQKRSEEQVASQPTHTREHMDQLFDENVTNDTEEISKPQIPSVATVETTKTSSHGIQQDQVPHAAAQSGEASASYDGEVLSESGVTISHAQSRDLSDALHRLRLKISDLRNAAFRSGEFDRRYRAASEIQAWKDDFPSKSAHERAQKQVYDKEVLMLEGFAADFSELLKDLEGVAPAVQPIPEQAAPLETYLDRRDRFDTERNITDEGLEALATPPDRNASNYSEHRREAGVGEIVAEDSQDHQDHVHPYELGKPMASTEHLTRPYRVDFDIEEGIRDMQPQNSMVEERGVPQEPLGSTEAPEKDIVSYKIITQKLWEEPNIITSVSEAPPPEKEKRLPLSTALSGLDDPASVLKVASPFLLDGYVPVGGSENMLILRHVSRQSPTAEPDKPSSSLDSSSSVSTRANPVDGTTAPLPETLTGHFFSPTGFVNLDLEHLGKSHSVPSSRTRAGKFTEYSTQHSQPEHSSGTPDNPYSLHSRPSRQSRRLRRRAEREARFQRTWERGQRPRYARMMWRGFKGLIKWVLLLPVVTVLGLSLIYVMGVALRLTAGRPEGVLYRRRETVEERR